MQELLDRMRDRVLRHANDVPVPGVVVAVARKQTGPEAMVCVPGICLVLQGTKQLVIGEDTTLRQEPGSSFASLTALPATRCLFETRERAPYVAVGLTIDHEALASLLASLPPTPAPERVAPFTVAKDARELLEAWDRLVALFDTPADIPALAPARQRELLYRLLQSPHGLLLRQLARDEGAASRVRRALDWMRANFERPMAMKVLADLAGMSVPVFNRHFRAATASSPLQYQKMLRLQAARHMLARDGDVSGTAYAVGYRSVSQFSREYTRHFGQPPKQDGRSLRPS